MTTIQACVNPRLLTKASRLVHWDAGGPHHRAAPECLVPLNTWKSPTRTASSPCETTAAASTTSPSSSTWAARAGRRISAPAKTRPALGCSAAPRAATIHSNGRMVQISDEGWHAPVEVLPDPDPVPGTIVQFEDDEWSHATVSPLAVFSGLNVAVDDCPCATETFVGERAVHIRAGLPDRGEAGAAHALASPGAPQLRVQRQRPDQLPRPDDQLRLPPGRAGTLVPG